VPQQTGHNTSITICPPPPATSAAQAVVLYTAALNTALLPGEPLASEQRLIAIPSSHKNAFAHTCNCCSMAHRPDDWALAGTGSLAADRSALVLQGDSKNNACNRMNRKRSRDCK
jgi:hypothetical protein